MTITNRRALRTRALVWAALVVAPVVHWLALGPEIPEGTYFLISRLGSTGVDGDPSNLIYSFARSWSFALVGWTMAWPAAFLTVGLIAHALMMCAIFVMVRDGLSPGLAHARTAAAAATLLAFPLLIASGLGGGSVTLAPDDAFHTFSIRTLFWMWMAVVYLLALRGSAATATWAAAFGPLLHPNAGILAFGIIVSGLLLWHRGDRRLVVHAVAALVVAAVPAVVKMALTDTSVLAAPPVSYAEWYSSVIKDEADDFSFLFQLIYRIRPVAAITAAILVTAVVAWRIAPRERVRFGVAAALFVLAIFYGGAFAEYVFAVRYPTPLIHALIGLTPGYRVLSFAFFPIVAVAGEVVASLLTGLYGERYRPAAVLVTMVVVATWGTWLGVGVARGAVRASVDYGRWAFGAGKVDGIDAYLWGAAESGRDPYFTPPLFAIDHTVVTYPGERSPFAVAAADAGQPSFMPETATMARFTGPAFVQLARAIRTRIPRGSGLIIPPYLRYFRDALVEYPVFFQEHHDGNLMLGAPQFFGFWRARMDALLGETYESIPSKTSGLNYSAMRHAFLRIDRSSALRLLDRFPEYPFFVTEREHRLGVAPLFISGPYAVYDLRQLRAGAAPIPEG